MEMRTGCCDEKDLLSLVTTNVCHHDGSENQLFHGHMISKAQGTQGPRHWKTVVVREKGFEIKKDANLPGYFRLCRLDGDSGGDIERTFMRSRCGIVPIGECQETWILEYLLPDGMGDG